MEKIKQKKAQTNQRPVISSEVKKYMGFLKFLIVVVIVALALTLLSYLFTNSSVFSQIKDFFKGVY